jgi:hypothetical protein
MARDSEDNINYKVTQGDTFRLELTYLDPDDLPISLAGYTFLAEVKDKPGGKVLCATATLGDGITVIDEEGGVVEIEFSPDKTRKFMYPKAAYQIQAIQGSDAETLIQGWFQVNAGVID